MSKVIGVIYPVPLRFVDRLFVENRNVFARYVGRFGREPVHLKLAPKHRVVFYASHGSGEVAGEGIIDALEFLTPDEALEKFGDRLFLDKDELTKYVFHQPTRTLSKKMLVLTLSKLRRYPAGVKYEKRMTMVGEYLTEKSYKILLHKVDKTRSAPRRDPKKTF